MCIFVFPCEIRTIFLEYLMHCDLITSDLELASIITGCIIINQSPVCVEKRKEMMEHFVDLVCSGSTSLFDYVLEHNTYSMYRIILHLLFM